MSTVNATEGKHLGYCQVDLCSRVGCNGARFFRPHLFAASGDVRDTEGPRKAEALQELIQLCLPQLDAAYRSVQSALKLLTCSAGDASHRSAGEPRVEPRFLGFGTRRVFAMASIAFVLVS